MNIHKGINPAKVEGLGTQLIRPEAKIPQGGSEFKNALKDLVPAKATHNALETTKLPAIKFSNHAIERMHSRGISLSPKQMQRMEAAVDKAAKKGAKNTLVITDNSALVVNVQNKTVITAIDRALMKENVFTQIDSTVLI